MSINRFFGRRTFSSPFKIRAGDLIEFGYTTKSGKNDTRQAIVISPEFDYPNGVVMGVILARDLPDNDFLSLVKEPLYSPKYKKHFRSFFLDGARALQKIDVKLPTQSDADVVDQPDRYLTWDELDAMAVKRYVWMANRQGGQSTGNKTIIVPINKDIFYNFVHNKTSVTQNFEEYSKRHKNIYASFVSIEGVLPPKLVKIDTITNLVPKPEDPRWVKSVDSFVSREAMLHRYTFDDELEDNE